VRVLIVPNTDNPAAVEAARVLATALPEAGHAIALAEDDAFASGLDSHSVARSALGEPEIAVALGGDGTILKAVHLLAGADVPILGINLGRLGFLSGARDGDVVEEVLATVAGRATEERRSTLTAVVTVGGRASGSYDALNEVFIGRGAGSRAVEVAVAVDGEPLARWVADGLIVATPTGSTAYALSAGGPLLDPALRGLLVVPVGAHSLKARPLVLAEGATVSVTFPEPARADACVVVDGDVVPCRTALDGVDVRVGAADVRLLRLDGRAFVTSVRETFLS
jgi:NAD+ kinase